jgi:predicted nucleotidyltransferase
MSTSNQTYKQLAIPYFKEVFDDIDEIMVQLSIPYYLIGASAIALQLLKIGVKPSRATKDVDFAIMISSMDEYDQLSDSLVGHGFNSLKAPWTFFSEKYNVALDILPFGEIQEQDTVQFNERYSDLHVLGFKEVLEDPEKVQIEEKIVNIPPLTGMVILKLVAWSDRPEERENDLADILRIIEHYFEYNYDEIVEFHHDTFPEEGFDRLLIALEVLGRKAKKILRKSEVLSHRIAKVLAENLEAVGESKIARDWASKKGWEIEYALGLMRAFQKGLNIKHESG